MSAKGVTRVIAVGQNQSGPSGAGAAGFPEPARPPARGLSRSASRAEPPPRPRRGQASEEMEDDDYWATITFDKPKFPWQHDDGRDRPVGEDPLAGVGPPEEE